MRKKLLIVTMTQFGYHVDAYYYCKFLADQYDIHYICWDYGRPRIALEGVRVLYRTRNGSKLRRYLRWLGGAIVESAKGYQHVFIKYFPGCSAIRLARRGRPTICDIRSGAVSTRARKRRLYDCLLRCESRAFHNVTIISESLRDRLRLPVANAHILPLGAEPLATGPKLFERIDLLYVGSLQGRRIDDTIQGLRIFLNDHPAQQSCRYTIVGSGPNDEEQSLRRLVCELGLQEVVQVVGAVPHDRLGSYFQVHNIGVSYIPVTEYFDCQPPTKTFEYLLSGMAVIGTATSENGRVISSKNGVLIPDTPTGFAAGLWELWRKRQLFSSSAIQAGAQAHRWRSIVEGNLLPFLKKIESEVHPDVG